MENGNYGHKSNLNVAGERSDKNELSVRAQNSTNTCDTYFNQLRDFWSNTERGGSPPFHGCKSLVCVAPVPEVRHTNNTQSNNANVPRCEHGNKKYCSEDGEFVTGRKVSSLRPQLQYDNAHPDENSNYTSRREQHKNNRYHTAEEVIHSKSVMRDVHPRNDASRPVNASHEPIYTNTRKHSDSIEHDAFRNQSVGGRQNSINEPQNYFVLEENGSVYKDIALDGAMIMNDRYSHETRSSHGRKSAIGSRKESSSENKAKGSLRGYPPITRSQRATYDDSNQRYSRVYPHTENSTRSGIQGDEFNSRAPAYATTPHETQRSSGNARDLQQLTAPMANAGKASRHERSILYEEHSPIPSESLHNVGRLYDDVDDERCRITQEPATLSGFHRESFGGDVSSKCACENWCPVREDELIYEEAIDPRRTSRNKQKDGSVLRSYAPQGREVGGRRRSTFHERTLDQTAERGSQTPVKESISTDEQIYHDSECQTSFPQNGAINGRRSTPVGHESHRGQRSSMRSNNTESAERRRTLINRAVGTNGEVIFEDRFDDPSVDYTLERRKTRPASFRMVSFSGEDRDRRETQRSVEMESGPHGDMAERGSSTVKLRSKEQSLRYSHAPIHAPGEGGSFRASRGGTEQIDEYMTQQRRTTLDERRVTADLQRQPAVSHLIEAEKYKEFRDVSTEMVDGNKRGGSLLIECRSKYNRTKGSSVIKGTDTTSMRHKSRRADKQPDINAVHDTEGSGEKIEVEIIGIIRVSPEECQKLCELCGNVLIAKPGENEGKKVHFIGNSPIQTKTVNYNGSIADGRSFRTQGRSKSDYNCSFINKGITDDKERVNSSKSARVVKRLSESKDCFISIGNSCRQSSHRSILRSESALSEGSIMTACDDNDDVHSSNPVTLGLDVEPSIDMKRPHCMNSFSAKNGGNISNSKRFHILQRVRTESSDSEYHVTGSKKERQFRASDMRKTLNIETYSEDSLSKKFNSGHDQKGLSYHFKDRKSDNSRHLLPECELATTVDRRNQAISGENNDNPSTKVHQTREDRRFIRKRVSHGRRIKLIDPTVHSRYGSASDGELPATAFSKDILESIDDSVTFSLHETESRTDIEQPETGIRTDKMKGIRIKNTKKAASFNYPENMFSFDEDLAYKLTSRSKLLRDNGKRRARAAVLKRKLRKQSEKQDLLFHNPTDDKYTEGDTTIRLKESTSEESWVNQVHFPNEGRRSYTKRISQKDYSSKHIGKKIKQSSGDCNSHAYRNRRRKLFRRYETGEVQCASPLATTDYSEIDFFNKHSKKIKKSILKGNLDVKVESKLNRNRKNKHATASSSEEEIGYPLFHSENQQHKSMTYAKGRAVTRGRRIHNIPENSLKFSADVISASISVTSTSLRSEDYDFEDHKRNHNGNNGRSESSHSYHSVNNIVYPFLKSEKRVKMKMGLRDSCYEHMKCSSSGKLTESGSYVSFNHYSTDGKYSYMIPERENEFPDCKTYDGMWKNLPQKLRLRGHSRDSRTRDNIFRPTTLDVATKHVKLSKEEVVEHNDDQMIRQKYPFIAQTECGNVMVSRNSQDEYSNSAGESTDFDGVVNGNANMSLKTNKGIEDELFYDKSSFYETTSYTESDTANENSSAKDLNEEAVIQVLPRISDESMRFTGQKLHADPPNEVLRARKLVCDQERNFKYTSPHERVSLSETSLNSSVHFKRMLYERKISELRSVVAKNKITARTIRTPSCTSLRKKITVEKKNIEPDLEKINYEKSSDELCAIQEENTAPSQGNNKINPLVSTHDRAAIHDIAAEKENTSRETTYVNKVMTGQLARLSSKECNKKEIMIEGKQSQESSHVCEGTESAFERTDLTSLNKKFSSLDNDSNISGRKNSSGEVKSNDEVSTHELQPILLSERIEEWNRAIESCNKSDNVFKGTRDQKRSFSSFLDQEKENKKESIQSLQPVEGPCFTHIIDREDHDEISEKPIEEIPSSIYMTSCEVNGKEHFSRNNLPVICKKEASTGSITGSSQWESCQTEDTEDGAWYSRNKDSYRDRVYSTDRPGGGKDITRRNPHKEAILMKRGNLGWYRFRKMLTEGKYPVTDLCPYTIMEEREDVAKDSYNLTRSTPVPERQQDVEYGKLSRSKHIIRRWKPKYFTSMLHKEANLSQDDACESTQRGISLKNLFIKSAIKGDDKQNSKKVVAFCEGTSVRYLGEVKQCGVHFAPMRPSVNKKARETDLIQSKECYFKNCNRVKRSLLAPSTTDNIDGQSKYSYSTRVNSPLNENVVNEYVKQKTEKYIPAIILLKERTQQYSRELEGNKTGMRSTNAKKCKNCGKVKNNNIWKMKTVSSKKKRTRVTKKCV